jgi:hypothetical protein
MGGLTSSLFLCTIEISHIEIMDLQTVNEIIYNLEGLLNQLKSEVNSEVTTDYEEVNVDYEETSIPITDYDEIFENDEY